MDRQTKDRCIHPTLGLGLATYDNGPASFVADSGEAVPCRSIGFGGIRSEPLRSWNVAQTAAGERIELETTYLQHGDRHQRRWSPLFGLGWLVHLASIPTPKGATKAEEARCHASHGRMRFDPDAGEPVHFQWSQASAGPKGYKYAAGAKAKPGSKAAAKHEEARHWTTFGEFDFRDSPPADASPDKQTSLVAS